ncbi:hypothetical protein ACSBR1_003057 [Camellia fascicularis]
MDAQCRVNISISSGVAAILDTALLQALLLTGQSSAAVELLKASLWDWPYACAVLECCPTQTIELYLSGNILADLVNSYLKQHAPNMQAMYLELMLAMNENGISRNLQNGMVQIYLSEVLDWYADLNSQQKWDEKVYPQLGRRYNPETLLKRLPTDALYEERAILLEKMTQHEVSSLPEQSTCLLILRVEAGFSVLFKCELGLLHVPELVLSYCDRVYEPSLHQPSAKSYSNIYLTLLQIYLNPQKKTKNFEKRITNLVSTPNSGLARIGAVVLAKNQSKSFISENCKNRGCRRCPNHSQQY